MSKPEEGNFWIAVTDGAAIIYREDGHRHTPASSSVLDRDLAAAVIEAK